jgi:hypothetical protein
MASDSDIQALIVLEVGDEVTTAWPSGVLNANIVTMWASFADKAQIAPRLQELYTKRRAIDAVLGIVRGQVTYNIANDHSRNQSDKAKTLLSMRKETQDEIVRVEMQARSNRPGVAGQITTTAPISPPVVGGVDANDPRFQGSPYFPPLGDRKA